GGDIDIAGADDLVDLRHAFGAVRQCGDGLGATHGEYAIDTGDGGGGEHQFVDFATGRRHRHDHFGDASDLRRDRIHQHRRGIRRLAAGHINADAIERRDFLAEHGTVVLAVLPRILLLLLVVAANAVRGALPRGPRPRPAPPPPLPHPPPRPLPPPPPPPPS